MRYADYLGICGIIVRIECLTIDEIHMYVSAGGSQKMKTKLLNIYNVLTNFFELGERGGGSKESLLLYSFTTIFFLSCLFVKMPDYVCPPIPANIHTFSNEATCPHGYAVFLSSWDYTCLITCTRCV